MMRKVTAILGLGILCFSASASLATAAELFDLVGQVSQTDLTAHISALEADRSSAAGKAAAPAHITVQLDAYGYTVSTQPVGSSRNLSAAIVG